MVVRKFIREIGLSVSSVDARLLILAFLCIGVEADARSTLTFLTTKRSCRTPWIVDLRSSMPRAVHPGALTEPAGSPSPSCDSSCDGRSCLKNCRFSEFWAQIPVFLRAAGFWSRRTLEDHCYTVNVQCMS